MWNWRLSTLQPKTQYVETFSEGTFLFLNSCKHIHKTYNEIVAWKMKKKSLWKRRCMKECFIRNHFFPLWERWHLKQVLGHASIVPYFLTEKFDEKLIAKPFRIFRGRLKFKRATADLMSKTQYVEKSSTLHLGQSYASQLL